MAAEANMAVDANRKLSLSGLERAGCPPLASHFHNGPVLGHNFAEGSETVVVVFRCSDVLFLSVNLNLKNVSVKL
jgi:hypothetical protein